MAKSKESIEERDLYEPVKELLEKNGYEVRGEVKFCDVAAVKGEELIIVELKKSLSVELFAQAVNRQKSADLVYMAVPKPKRIIGTSKWNDICHMARRLELGLILVSFNGEKPMIEIALEPIPFDREKSIRQNKKKRETILKEISGRKKDLNRGGSRGKKLVTAYREISIFIACCLERYGEMSIKELKKLGTDEKKTGGILRDNHYEWFENVDRGIYKVTDKGKEEINKYIELKDYYKEILEKTGHNE